MDLSNINIIKSIPITENYIFWIVVFILIVFIVWLFYGAKTHKFVGLSNFSLTDNDNTNNDNDDNDNNNDNKINKKENKNKSDKNNKNNKYVKPDSPSISKINQSSKVDNVSHDIELSYKKKKNNVCCPTPNLNTSNLNTSNLNTSNLNTSNPNTSNLNTIVNTNLDNNINTKDKSILKLLNNNKMNDNPYIETIQTTHTTQLQPDKKVDNFVPSSRYSNESKREAICRQSLESIYKKQFPRCRPDFLKNPLTGYNLELDMFNEELMIALEEQDISHVAYPNRYHKTKEEFIKRVQYDKYKADRCAEHGVYLITLPYTVPINQIYNYILERIPENINKHNL